MSKAVLVIDMPEKCAWCQLGRLFGTEGAAECTDTNRVNRNCESVPDWCPLRPMPEKMNCIPGEFEDGWNACIDEICESKK